MGDVLAVLISGGPIDLCLGVLTFCIEKECNLGASGGIPHPPAPQEKILHQISENSVPSKNDSEYILRQYIFIVLKQTQNIWGCLVYSLEWNLCLVKYIILCYSFCME